MNATLEVEFSLSGTLASIRMQEQDLGGGPRNAPGLG